LIRRTEASSIRRRRRAAAAGAAACLVLAPAPDAFAQADPNPSAAALFQKGRDLLEAGNYREACPLLERSLRQLRGTGTLLAVAICHEGLGATATAWSEFREVADASHEEGRGDREQFARERVRKLEPRLARLTIAVAPADASVAGLVVTRDGQAVAASFWGVEVPVDRGDHEVRATAIRRAPWAATVHLEDGQRRTVTVVLPPRETASEGLFDSSPGTSPPAPGPTGDVRAPDRREGADATTDARARGDGGRKTTGWVVGAAGLVALGVGAFFGVRAITSSSDARSRCSLASCTDPSAVSENDDAKVSAWVADGAVGAGLIALGIGAYLILTSPSDTHSAPSAVSYSIGPSAGPSSAGISLHGSW
jgi:hypothetical protein